MRVSSRIGRYVAWNSSMPPTLTAPSVSPWYPSATCTYSGFGAAAESRWAWAWKAILIAASTAEEPSPA